MKKILYLLFPVFLLLYACFNNSDEINQGEEILNSSSLYLDILAKDGNRKIESVNLNNESNRTHEGCDSYVVQETGCEVSQITELIQVPPYCNFVKVSYTLRICNDAHIGSPVIFVITNFTATPLEGPDELGCTDFIDLLNDLPYSEKIELFEAFQYAAGLVVENALVEEWGSSISDGTLQANFYRDLCYQWFTFTSDGNGKGGESYEAIGIEKVLCGTQCCIRKTNYELDHGVITPSEPVFESIGSCEPDVHLETVQMFADHYKNSLTNKYYGILS